MMQPKVYMHLNSGNKYTVLSRAAKMKKDGIWYDAVMYYSNQDPRMNFVRTVEDFEEKFREVTTPYTGKRGY